MKPEKRADTIGRPEPLIEAGRWAIIKRGSHHFVAGMNDRREVDGLTFFPAELALVIRQMKNKSRAPRRAQKNGRRK